LSPRGAPRLFLVQLLVPTEGDRADARRHERVRAELLARFGGVTAYSRAPAAGLWTAGATRRRVVRDDIVVYEVLTSRLDIGWWRDYRRRLCRRFDQAELVVHAHPVTLI
jgi:hypothetical protein